MGSVGVVDRVCAEGFDSAVLSTSTGGNFVVDNNGYREWGR